MRNPRDRPDDGAAPAPGAGLALLETQGFADYRLLDSGQGRKLERFGAVTVDRPEPQALWRPRLAPDRWSRADAVFAGDGDDEAGKWRLNGAVAESWPLRLMGVTLLGRLGAFRHLGLFPEQLPHWEWMLDGLARKRAGPGAPRPRVLNLFAYTGAASLLAARAGAEVVHVDASRKAIAWARENQAASGLGEAPVRWLLDDARKLAARELRRGRSYDIILIDPPKFGRGPDGEVWDLFEHLPGLLRDCARLLARDRARLILTAYAIRASATSIAQLLAEVLADQPGMIESGELLIREEGGGRAISTSLFARWCADG